MFLKNHAQLQNLLTQLEIVLEKLRDICKLVENYSFSNEIKQRFEK